MIDTWRTERFLSYIICPSNTFIIVLYMIGLNKYHGNYWYIRPWRLYI
nr:MAG TPA: hypothetical protein [Caudoviricetes sp.]